MLSKIEQARITARKAIEVLYEGKCTIIGYENKKNLETLETEQKEIECYKDKPCNLNINIKPVKQTETEANIEYDAVLFIAPEVQIEAGSTVYVTQRGITYKFEQTGEPAIFSTHQEIMLKRIDRT